MTEEEWNNSVVRVIGMLLNGSVMDEYSERGERIRDDVVLMMINGYWEDVPFCVPGKEGEPDWEVLVDTADPEGREARMYRCGEVYNLTGRSLVLLRQPLEEVIKAAE